jgi:hypothetical protein
MLSKIGAFGLLLAASLAVCACTVMSTYPVIDGSGQRATGFQYSLAKALILARVRVIEQQAKFLVCISDEVPIEDPKHQYVLSYNASPFSADKFTLDAHAGTSVLQQIDVKAIDKTDEFAVNLASSLGALAAKRVKESGASSSLVAQCTSDEIETLGNVYMDPAEPADTQDKVRVLNKVILEYAGSRAEQCASPLEQDHRLDRNACKEYLRIVTAFNENFPPLKMVWRGPTVPKKATKAGACETGVCYRARLPFMLNISMAGVTVDSVPFSLPNDSPIVAMDISRGIAITKTTKITFDRLGVPTQIFVQKGQDDGVDGAEAVELAKLPADVIAAYFDTFAATVSKFNTALSNQKTLAETKLALIKAKSDLAGARKKESGTSAADVRFVAVLTNAVASAKKMPEIIAPAPAAKDKPDKADAPAPEKSAETDKGALPGPGQ